MKRTSSPRQRFTLEERRTLLAAFRDGQLSARDFVRQHGFSLATLYRWQVRPTGGAALLMAIFLRGLNPRELAALLPLLR